MQVNNNIAEITQWLSSCDLFNDQYINVDYLDEKVYSFSVDKTPSDTIVKTYLDGTLCIRQITFDLAINMPLTNRAIDNLINSRFCDELVGWVSRQNKLKNLPNIEGAKSIEVTSNPYVLLKNETKAVYLIQFNFQYLSEI